MYTKRLPEHLEAVDDAVAEKDLVIILVSSLPEEYNYLITALETIAEDKLTWDHVRDRLTHEYDKMQHGSIATVKNETCQDAMFSKKCSDQKKNNFPKNFQWHYCKKTGHFARDCYKKKADSRNTPTNSTARMAEGVPEAGVENPEIATEIALSAGSPSSTKNDSWIDSGASQHMTPDKKGMDAYITFTKPLQARLADNTVLFAYGKGNEHILTYDGKEKVNIIFKNVLCAKVS